MKTLSFCDSFFKDKECVIALGVFDGVHKGHNAILEKTVKIAKQMGVLSVALTFNKNPKMYKGTEETFKPLTTKAQFTNLLSKKALDYNCVIDFSDDMSKLTGEEFIARLCTSYKVRAMVVGKGFKCGNPVSSAGEEELKKLLNQYTSSAFLEVVNSVLLNNETVSSTLVRKSILTGDMEKASMLLGRAYSLDLTDCKVTEKDKRLLFDVRALVQLLPKEGTYKVKATGKAIGALNSNPKETDALMVISEDYLALDLPVRIKPDTILFL